MQDDEDEKTRDGEDRARSLMEIGGDLAGALGGTGASLVAGPFAGAAIGVAISKGAKAVSGRLLEREEVRVGATLALIAEDAKQRQQRGERPREDRFFDDRGTLRPEAEDLLEGILRHAAAAYEEQKVALFAQLFSATAHTPRTRADEAVFIARLVGELTYRQLVILSAFRTHDPRQVQKVLSQTHAAALDDLGERGLLAIKTEGGLRAPGRLAEKMTYADLESFPTRLSEARQGVQLTPLGIRLIDLTDATVAIPGSERNAVLRLLAEAGSRSAEH